MAAATAELDDANAAAILHAEAAIEALVTPARPCLEDRTPGPFSEQLLVGSGPHALAVADLAARGVTAVLNCASGACPTPEAEYTRKGIAFFAIAAEDEAGYAVLEKHLEEARAFLDPVLSSGGLALVHCFAGVNRSAAIAIAYLMLSYQRPLLDVVEECFASRPFILTNRSFRRELVVLAHRSGLLGPRAVDGRSEGTLLAAAAAAPGAATNEAAQADAAADAAPDADAAADATADAEDAADDAAADGAGATDPVDAEPPHAHNADAPPPSPPKGLFVASSAFPVTPPKERSVASASAAAATEVPAAAPAAAPGWADSPQRRYKRQRMVTAAALAGAPGGDGAQGEPERELSTEA